MARRPISRKVERTALDLWRERENLSLREVSELLGVSAPAVYHWCVGRSLPTLIMAFHIEDVSDGEVPASSWVATQLGLFEKAGYEERAARTQRKLSQRMKRQRAERLLTEDYRRELKRSPFRKVETTVLGEEGEVVLTTKREKRGPANRLQAEARRREAALSVAPLHHGPLGEPPLNPRGVNRRKEGG